MTIERRRRIVRRRRTLISTVLVAAISCLAGMTDAVGLLVAGNFVSFMSGNTTRAAVALADGQGGHAAILFGALGIFIVGNALGIIIAHRTPRRTFTVLTGVTVVLGVAAILPGAVPALQFYAIVLAMGMVNAAVEQIDGLPIGLTYVTGALSRFGRGLGRWIVGDTSRDWMVQIVPWIGMAGGGIVGAGLEHLLGPAVLWITCAFSAALAVLAYFIPPRLQQRLAPRPSAPIRTARRI